MRAIKSFHDTVFSRLEALTTPILATLARFLFAATLLVYYVNSASLKFGPGLSGLVRPDFGAYAAVLPRSFEAAGYDVSALGTIHWLIVFAGMWAELLLPVAIVLGLFTRLAALGMVGFIAVQSWVDLFGHGGLANGVLGGWFDRLPDGIILDQRAFWVFLLLFLVFRGAGPISLDRVLRNATSARRDAPRPARA